MNRFASTKRPADCRPFQFANAGTPDRWKCRSTRRLAATGYADFFLEIIKADRADHHLLADHVAWRAVHTHRLGEFEVFLDRSAHFRGRKLLLDRSWMDDGLLAGCHPSPLVPR